MSHTIMMQPGIIYMEYCLASDDISWGSTPEFVVQEELYGRPVVVADREMVESVSIPVRLSCAFLPSLAAIASIAPCVPVVLHACVRLIQLHIRP